MIHHKHHIIPKHMGGTDDPSNLITVTYSGIIPSLQCLKCDFNLFGDGGVAIGLGTSWEVEHYFKVDIPKFKRVEDFQACKNAYNMCKLKINSFKKLKDFPYNRCRIDYSFDHQL